MECSLNDGTCEFHHYGMIMEGGRLIDCLLHYHSMQAILKQMPNLLIDFI